MSSSSAYNHHVGSYDDEETKSLMPPPQDSTPLLATSTTSPAAVSLLSASLTSGWLMSSSWRPSPTNNSFTRGSTPYSAAGNYDFLSCSPMVSGPRSSIHLPNLDLREARRAAILAANRRLASSSSAELFKKGKNGIHSRQRSNSLGNQRENLRTASPLTFLHRHTPSGLSLMDLSHAVEGDDDAVEKQQALSSRGDVHRDDDVGYNLEHDGYGSTSTVAAITTKVYTEPLKTAGDDDNDDDRPILKESQSCNIADLGIELSPPYRQRHHDHYRDSSDKTLLQELKEEFASQSTPALVCILYGLVNTTIILPILMSFGSIIYHDDFFRPYLSVLMKLTVVSGAVHQITFSSVSSLPFAVGQVQDAGLIFLSAMARDIVSKCKAVGVDDVSILATTTVGLSMFTAILGVALILIGKFKLASYCQLLPSSVIGGYLAYIGFFCGQAGLALMAMVDVQGLRQWYKFLDSHALLLLTPGVVGGFCIYFSVRAFRHMAVLPSSIAMLMVFFYVILWTKGMSVEEATQLGWINKTIHSPAWFHTWDFLQIDKVVWRVLPSQTVTILAMISVVALSSSLDIAAIEIEMKRPLDYNHELKTVGISNIVSGITGGYTGSYIFSQTIFSLRMGIRSPLMGYVIAAMSLVTVALPFNVLAYIPNFFFGSLLIMICLDLMFEWLIDVREKVTLAEYVVVLISFCLLLALGVELGILAGICVYVIVERIGFDVGKERTAEDVVAAAMH